MFSEVQAIIFDLDGLVIDSEITYQQAWRLALQELNQDLDQIDFMQFSGCDAATVESRLLASCDQNFELNDFRRLSAAKWHEWVARHGMPVKPGLQAVLTEINRLGWAYALATNSPRAQALQLLARAGLSGVFNLIIARDQVAKGKPAPDLLYLAARHLAVPPPQCLVLEDSWTGLQASVAAGMRCCLIPSHPTNTKQQALAILTLDDLGQLAERLQRLSV